MAEAADKGGPEHPRVGLLRVREPHSHARVTFVELFFDLVFVFAVTQLSHSLAADLTPGGLLRTAILFLAVWWVWVYTSWVTNWLDPDRAPARLMLFGLMLLGLLLSASIPGAFGVQGWVFALAYVAMHLGRTVFMIWAIGGTDQALRRNFLRILAWLALATPLWLIGGVLEGPWRVGLWLAALGIEYISPAAYFWVPRLGRSASTDWSVEGAHMAERCGLFVIIALGETVLVTGQSYAGMDWSVVHLAAFLTAFVGSVAMWWIYFHVGAERGSEAISRAADPGRMARLGYTYLHLLIVGGIVLGATADEVMLEHPTGHAEPRAVAVMLGAPALYLLGLALFKRLSAPRLPLSHLVGLGLLALLVPVAPSLPPLGIGMATSAVLVVVAAWEHLSLRVLGTKAA